MTPDRIAYNILLKVTRDDAFLNLAIKEASAPQSYAPHITALLYSALEHIGYCDHLIDHYSRSRVHFSVRTILRLSLTEMFFMNMPDHAVCSRAVSLTAEIGKDKLKGFVNGVLRSIARDRDSGRLPELPSDFVERTKILSGYPEFLIREYVRKYGEGFTEELLGSSVKSTSIRAVSPYTADELMDYAKTHGLSARISSIVPGSVIFDCLESSIADFELFTEGRITVQSESAMLACRILDPKPGMSVLDACAAPGGKTAYIHELMARKGNVTAWDVHPHRAELILSTLKRLGDEGVSVSVHDAAIPDASLFGCFDRVLCDVPCSGLGGASKPDAKLRRTKESVEELSKLQYSILDTCSGYLRPGGLIVYSTCTVSDSENEEVVKRFLSSHDDFELCPFTDLIPERLKDRGGSGMLQLFPNTDGTEGFFIARLRRIG